MCIRDSYRTVAEALQESYPESPYLQSLQAEIARIDVYKRQI